MKTIVLLFFLAWTGLSVVANVTGGSGTASLFSWQLVQTAPGHTDNKNLGIAGVNFNFVSNYNISDWYFDIQLINDDCTTIPSISYPHRFTQVTESIANGFNSIEYTLFYNQALIESTSLWTANETGGYFDFCVVLNMYLESSLKTKVATHNTVYQIQIHESDTRVIADSPTNEEYALKDYEENVLVYQCDDSFNAINDTVPVHAGEMLQICVETDPNSKFEVRTIFGLTVSQAGERNYTYISEDANSPLCIRRCIDLNTESAKCLVKMQLLSSYYESNILFVDIEGIVRFDYIPRRRSLSSDGNKASAIQSSESHDSINSAKEIQGSFKFKVQLGNDTNSMVTLTPQSKKRLVSCVMIVTYLIVVLFA